MPRTLLVTFYHINQEDSGVAKRFSTHITIQLFKYFPIKIWHFSLKKFLHNCFEAKSPKKYKILFSKYVSETHDEDF